MKTKVCKKCNTRKRLHLFIKHPYYKDGISNRCKSCHNLYLNNYRANSSVYKTYMSSADNIALRKDYNKEYNRYLRETLQDTYIKKLITKETKQKTPEITAEQIEFKREHLKLKRLLNEKTRQLNASGNNVGPI